MDNQQLSINLFTEENFKSALIGTLLGDTSIEARSGSFAITHSIIYEDYVQLKHDLFKKFTNVGKIGISNNWGSNPDESLRKAKRFRIYDKELRDKFRGISYDKNLNRKIPNNEYINEIVLFFWYLDDGSFIKRKITEKQISRHIRIGLKAFEDSEILRVIEFIKNKYNINFMTEIVSGKITRIYIRSRKDIKNFFNLLYPLYNYIPDSFKYKFQPEFSKKKNEDLSYLDKK